MIPLPTLPGLEAFEAVARHRSFTRAAAELGVTPSAVSHRVAALEDALGLQLFSRAGRQVSLTAEGRALVGAASEAFALLRGAVGELRAPGTDALTVSCSPSFAIRWLVPRLDRLRLAHPDLDLRIAADDRLVDLAREGIDAAVRYGPGGYAGEVAERLTDEIVFPVCSPALAAGPTPLRHPTDLAGVTLLHDTALHDHPARAGWRAWLRAAGAKGVDPEAGPRFSHLALALEAALAGQGVALARATLVGDALATGRLIKPFDLDVPSGLAYWLVTRPGDHRPAIDALRSWLRGELGVTGP